MIHRRCDSRNLNISPFCSLNSRMKPDKFYEVINFGYNSNPDYLSSMITPVRKFYPNEEMSGNEILKRLTAKVKPDKIVQTLNWLHLE